MKNYLALIRKADFIDLYRYGRIHISEFSSVEFPFAPEELSTHAEIFETLADNANEFDNAFVYIMIHYVLEDVAPKTLVNIEDVQNVFPLDFESQREFATSFDEHIRICPPLWNNAVFELQKHWAVQSCLKGAENIWKIFNIQYPIEKVRAIVTPNIVKQTIDILYSDHAISGEHPLLVYLLRYERHAFYPQGMIGHFMDAVHVYCNFYARQMVEQDMVETTGAFRVLAKIKSKLKEEKENRYSSLISKCTKDKGFGVFLGKLREVAPDFPFIEVAPVYLRLRSYFAEGLKCPDYSKTYETFLLSVNKREDILAFSMYLLGIALGHEKTYDALYESLPLAIFKPIVAKEPIVEQPQPKAPKKGGNGKATTTKTASKPAKQEIVAGVPMEITQPPVEEVVSQQVETVTTPSKTNEIPTPAMHQGVLFEETLPAFPCFMVQLTKNGKVPKNTKGKIRKVQTKEEYYEYKEKGYTFYSA